jgi:hypothetical protein
VTKRCEQLKKKDEREVDRSASRLRKDKGKRKRAPVSYQRFQWGSLGGVNVSFPCLCEVKDIERSRVLSDIGGKTQGAPLHPWFSAMAVWTGEAINGVPGNREDGQGSLGDSPRQCPFSAKSLHCLPYTSSPSYRSGKELTDNHR